MGNSVRVTVKGLGLSTISRDPSYKAFSSSNTTLTPSSPVSNIYRLWDARKRDETQSLGSFSSGKESNWVSQVLIELAVIALMPALLITFVSYVVFLLCPYFICCTTQFPSVCRIISLIKSVYSYQPLHTHTTVHLPHHHLHHHNHSYLSVCP